MQILSYESSCWKLRWSGYLLKYMFTILSEKKNKKNLWNRGEPYAWKLARTVRRGVIDVPKLSKDKRA